MVSARDFRFSSNVFRLRSLDQFIATCRHAEECGYDTIFTTDHLGQPAPFSTLVAAAGATSRIRVGTLVINVPFWNPTLLAREIATVDMLTGGRLEVGLGAGYVKREFDEAGIAWEPFGARAGKLSGAIGEMKRLFAAERQRASGQSLVLPVQRQGFGGFGPPLLVAGTGDRILRIAAEHADIVAIAGSYQIKDLPPGMTRLGSPEETDERVAFTRRCAGNRADEIEWHILIQAVVITDNRKATAVDLEERFVFETAATMLETPFMLIGTVDEIARQILRNRERYGFTYYTVHEPNLDAFAPVIERVRALSGRSA
jgi:probable F420-dependent oxidoreductase